MEHRIKLIRLFQITFFLGYVFRITIAGWFFVILFIPEYLFRSVYYMVGISLLDNEFNYKNILLNVSLQVLYLATSFFTYDGADGPTYTFAGLWVNPPEIVLLIWATLAFTTVILIGVSIFYHLKQNQYEFKINDWTSKFLMGCVILPIAAFCVGSGLTNKLLKK